MLKITNELSNRTDIEAIPILSHDSGQVLLRNMHSDERVPKLSQVTLLNRCDAPTGEASILPHSTDVFRAAVGRMFIDATSAPAPTVQDLRPGSGKTITITGNTTHTFQIADLGFSETDDNDALNRIEIKIPEQEVGFFALGNDILLPDDAFSATVLLNCEFGAFKFIPKTNATGAFRFPCHVYSSPSGGIGSKVPATRTLIISVGSATTDTASQLPALDMNDPRSELDNADDIVLSRLHDDFPDQNGITDDYGQNANRLEFSTTDGGSVTGFESARLVTTTESMLTVTGETLSVDTVLRRIRYVDQSEAVHAVALEVSDREKVSTATCHMETPVEDDAPDSDAPDGMPDTTRSDNTHLDDGIQAVLGSTACVRLTQQFLGVEDHLVPRATNTSFNNRQQPADSYQSHNRRMLQCAALVLRTANSFDYDPMRNQWIVADFNTANLQLGVLVVIIDSEPALAIADDDAGAEVSITDGFELAGDALGPLIQNEMGVRDHADIGVFTTDDNAMAAEHRSELLRITDPNIVKDPAETVRIIATNRRFDGIDSCVSTGIVTSGGGIVPVNDALLLTSMADTMGWVGNDMAIVIRGSALTDVGGDHVPEAAFPGIAVRSTSHTNGYVESLAIPQDEREHKAPDIAVTLCRDITTNVDDTAATVTRLTVTEENTVTFITPKPILVDIRDADPMPRPNLFFGFGEAESGRIQILEFNVERNATQP